MPPIWTCLSPEPDRLLTRMTRLSPPTTPLDTNSGEHWASGTPLTFLALDANSREHLVSGTFSAAGLTFTTSTHLLLAPRESSNKRVSCRGSTHTQSSSVQLRGGNKKKRKKHPYNSFLSDHIGCNSPGKINFQAYEQQTTPPLPHTHMRACTHFAVPEGDVPAALLQCLDDIAQGAQRLVDVLRLLQAVTLRGHPDIIHKSTSEKALSDLLVFCASSIGHTLVVTMRK
eukprot:scaffold75360_cov16-Tisochrysis_lutea.AAC.1